jgi:hypothetical protein
VRFFELMGTADFLLIGLLVANAWEAMRRARIASRRAAIAARSD